MKLQLGISRFDRLTPRALDYFLRPGWIHLGDAAGSPPSLAKARELVRDYGPANFAKICIAVFRRKLTSAFASKRAAPASPDKPLDSASTVIPFYYRKGDTLSFKDAEFQFVFSEHFFEHLFLDSALALLRECYRVTAPGGVIRICVPDADLRRNMAPEPAGFPYARMPFTHPEKHKIRWSVYSLSEALRLTGFTPLPLRYFDEDGTFHDFAPAAIRSKYPPALGEEDIVLTLDYVQRASSLIIDGVKETSSGNLTPTSVVRRN